MKRYIDANKLCELARIHIDNKVDVNDIMRFPAADVQEVRHGKNLAPTSMFECSICGFMDVDTFTSDEPNYNYCPYCGARMDGERE